MFSGICVVIPPELMRRCHVHFLKEKSQITRLPKDGTPKKFYFTLKPQVFLSWFLSKNREQFTMTQTGENVFGYKNFFIFKNEKKSVNF